MKILSLILMICFLFNIFTPSLAINCPDRYEWNKFIESLENNKSPPETKEWKRLSSSNKKLCEKESKKIAKKFANKHNIKEPKKLNLLEKKIGRNPFAYFVIYLIIGFLIMIIVKLFKNSNKTKTNITKQKKETQSKVQDAEKQTLEKAQSKIPKPMNQKKKEELKETLKWDETAKPEPIKEESLTEELKRTEVTITSQEEEDIYEQVAKELKENRSEGIWLKAYTENDGDEAKTKIAYTKKRVEALMKELKKNNLK